MKEFNVTNHWTLLKRTIFFLFTVASVALRLYRISEPRQVVFDEVHFGGFASHYLKGTYFFDVHPPLGKLIIAGIGHLYDYKGTFAFKDIGDPYENDPTVPFVQMRTAMALFSIGSIMFALATLVEMEFSSIAVSVAGILLSLDNGLITQSRFILLDGMMLFFIFGSVYFWTKFRQFRYSPFSVSWWTHLGLTGLFLAGTVGIKLVGLFTVALVGLACVYDLWELSDWRRQMSDRTLLRHFAARFVCLAVVPVVIYLSLYYVHFALLPHSGPGDGHMSIEFQKTLLGNKMNGDTRSVYYGQTFRIQNRGEKIYLHSHVDRIPLNHADGKVSSQGQQVNGYPIEDDNNVWEVKLIESSVETDDTANLLVANPTSNANRQPIRYGDEVKLCHRATEKCLMTHDVASALTRTNMEITMWESGGADLEEFTHWLIESDTGESTRGTPLKSLSSSFVLVNKHFKVKLMNFGKNLPAWGFGQRELNGCRKEGTQGDLMYSWMISDVLEARTEAEEAERLALQKQIKPMNFFKKFWQLQVYSLAANSNLIDEHPYKSRPHEWILPFKGLGFWNDGSKARIFMMGNIFAWTFGTFAIFLLCVRFPKDKFLEHRGQVKYFQDHRFFKRFGNKIAFLFGAYLLHYAPFYLMGRSLYLHHYLPSFMFSTLIAAAQFDYMTRKLKGSNYQNIRLVLLAIIFVSTLTAFIFLLPLVYGSEIESEVLAKRKFIKSWNF
jgi:dolichyl-phosphate-mannose-protein mannosyltransferase